jgi:hypothetical protein
MKTSELIRALEQLAPDSDVRIVDDRNPEAVRATSESIANFKIERSADEPSETLIIILDEAAR